MRPKNEDSVAFWQPEDAEEQRTCGAAVILADGVGGQGQGEVASRLAVDAALEKFREAKPGTSPRQVLWQMFTAANLAVYDRGMEHRDEGRMATTLTIAVLRNDELTIGHVGDCLAYLVQEDNERDGRSQLRRLAGQAGPHLPHDAADSQMRCI